MKDFQVFPNPNPRSQDEEEEGTYLGSFPAVVREERADQAAGSQELDTCAQARGLRALTQGHSTAARSTNWERALR